MRFLLIAATAATLSGCTLAEFNSINRQFNPTHGDSRLIDAKQRAIISHARLGKNGADGKPAHFVVCAEPSPDALQATAAALEGSGAFDNGNAEGALQAAAGFSESAASIGLRTQSIQLLRDSYYRNCEGFANGALDEVAFNVVHQRFQNHTVALLAIEQLTGAAIAPAVAIAATAEGSSEINVTNSGNAENSSPEQTNDASSSQEGEAQQQSGEQAQTEETQSNQASASTSGTEQNADTPSTGGDAANSSTNSSSSGGGNATGNGKVTTGSNLEIETREATPPELPEHVSRAVAAITHDALNQDYSVQLCLEFARDIFTKKEVFDLSRKNNLSVIHNIEKLNVSETALEFCRLRLTHEAERQAAVNSLVAAKADLVKGVAAGLARTGRSHLSDKHALEIIEAINVTLPNDTRTGFVDRTPLITSGGLTHRGDPCPDGYTLSRSQNKCVKIAK